MAEHPLAEAFAASKLLAGCDPERLSPVLTAAAAGEPLTDMPGGDPSVGLVVSGLIDVWSVAPDGNGVLLSTLRPGDCFGICNLLTGGGLETRLRAATPVEVAYIAKQALENCLAGDSAMALRYAALCNRKLQFLLHRIAMLTAQTSRGRLISWLTLHADADGRVLSHLSRTDLAAALSVSRAALYRELDALRDAGAIAMERDRITITDRAALEALL